MSTDDPIPPDLLFVHVHIHKCAGKAFGDLIQESFAHHHHDIYRDDLYVSWLPEELSALVTEHPRIRSLSSHNIRLFPDRIADREPLYVCFLRDPVEWFVSYLTYIRANFDALVPEHRAVLPADTITMPLAELADQQMAEHRATPRPYSTFIHYLAESTYRMQLAAEGRGIDWHAPLAGEDAHYFRRHGLEMAKRILTENFFFVGIVDQMEKSVDLLRVRLAQRGIQLAPRPARQINISRHYRDDLRWLAHGEPVGRAIREWLREDIQLYQWARQRFDEEFTQQFDGPRVERVGESSMLETHTLATPATVNSPENPWQTVDRQREFISVAGKLKRKKVLVAGDNASVLIQSLLDTGATVSVLVGHVHAQQRVRRRFPNIPCEVRTGPNALLRAKYDMAILWDGLGERAEKVSQHLFGTSRVVWACTLSEGWTSYKQSPVADDVIPDVITHPNPAFPIPAPGTETPIVVHVHVPKNGGTSMNNILFESFGYLFQPAYIDNPRLAHTPQSMDEAASVYPNTLALSSHSFRVFPERLNHRPAFYFTFLRHSLSRHLSYYRYARKYYDRFGEEHRKTLPANFMDMSPADYLAFEAHLYSIGYGFGQLRLFNENNDLAGAKETLSKFFVVGIIEQVDRGIELLRRKLKPFGFELVDLPMPHSNRTDDLYDQTEDLMKDPALLEKASHLREDIALYEWAKARFEAEATRYGI